MSARRFKHAAQDEESKKLPHRRCGTEKEKSGNILCECPALEKIRMQTLCFAGIDPDQIKEAKLSSIMVLGKSWIAE